MNAHNSEKIADCDERIKFISDFGGSNGICFLSTFSEYFIIGLVIASELFAEA
jgi:hypothetical protein